MSDSVPDSPLPHGGALENRRLEDTRQRHDDARPCTLYSPNLTALDSLITNSFTLNSGGPRPVAISRRPSATALRQRHPLAALNTNSNIVHTEDEDSNQSPRPVQKRMFTEDYSLYDAENSLQSQSSMVVSGSPRTTCSIATTDMDDDDIDDDDVLLPSADNSPVNFKVHLEKSHSNGGSSTKTSQEKSFDHHDTNSMDSGYGHSSQFRFVQPTGIAPRRLDSGISSSNSPSLTASAQKQTSFSVFNSCSSQGSLESMEDDYLDLFQLEDANGSFRLSSLVSSQQKSDMPNISSLICGAIKQQNTPERKTPNGPKMRVRRCLMMDESSVLSASDEDKENSSPLIIKRVSKVAAAAKSSSTESTTTPKRTSLMMLDVNQQQQQTTKAFKRPEPLIFSPVQSKRYKSEVFSKNVTFSGARTADPRLEAFSFEAKSTPVTNNAVALPQSAPLQRAVSMSETAIKNALSRSSSEPDLIGDFSKPFCLPHTAGRHNDLRSISVDTMAELVRGNYDDSVASFKVIDCRYPYEFEGGHIQNAHNMYTQEQILEELYKPVSSGATPNSSDSNGKRHILVFHCEFSSERGPKLFRFLRNHDRKCNTYPALHYPEIYLLDGGYKAFFEAHPELCDPIKYRMMLDPAYGQEYKTFRAKTKSWNDDNGRATTFKRVKSRSRIMREETEE